jgi:hypothetical protein
LIQRHEAGAMLEATSRAPGIRAAARGHARHESPLPFVAIKPRGRRIVEQLIISSRAHAFAASAQPARASARLRRRTGRLCIQFYFLRQVGLVSVFGNLIPRELPIRTIRVLVVTEIAV